VDYGPGVEAYRFLRNGSYVDVVWALEDVSLTIKLPGSKTVSIYDRAGSLLKVEAAQTEVTIGFSPMYLVHTP
jgi:hypothetical protein